MDLAEALAFHGLTKEKMSMEVIRWLQSVMLESPEVYRVLVTDPPAISPRISRYDFMFSLGMTTDAPRRRSWTDFMAIREFIQNALDVEERIFGYEGASIVMYQDDQGLHILDRGPGISYEAFKIGASDKSYYERGYFGEGLKMAAAHLVSRGCIVYAFNKRGQVFKVTTPDGNIVVALMGAARIPVRYPYGTEIVIYGASTSPDFLVNTVFSHWIKSHPEAKVYTKWYGDPKRPSSIVVAPGECDLLWVRDIIVNRISKITGKVAVFGYNLWWVSLEPNRIMVASIPELNKEAAMAHTRETIVELLKRVVADEGKYAVIEEDHCFETSEVIWWYAEKSVREAVAEYVKTMGAGVTTRPDSLDWFLYLGVKPLLIPSRMTDLFSLAPTAEDKAISLSEKRLEAAKSTEIPIESLTLRELISLGVAEELITAAHSDVRLAGLFVKAPEIVVCEDIEGASGMQSGDHIYVARSHLKNVEYALSVAMHEYAHWFGRNYLKLEAADVTAEFERALENVATAIIMTAMEERVNKTVRRIVSGGWRARTLVWNEKDKSYVYSDPLSYRFRQLVRSLGINIVYDEYFMPRLEATIDSSAPICIAVPLGDKVPARDIAVSNKTVDRVIPIDLPPNREPYFEIAGNEARELALSLRRTSVTFIYDPWKDEYVTYRRIVISD